MSASSDSLVLSSVFQNSPQPRCIPRGSRCRPRIRGPRTLARRWCAPQRLFLQRPQCRLGEFSRNSNAGQPDRRARQLYPGAGQLHRGPGTGHLAGLGGFRTTAQPGLGGAADAREGEMAILGTEVAQGPCGARCIGGAVTRSDRLTQTALGTDSLLEKLTPISSRSGVSRRKT